MCITAKIFNHTCAKFQLVYFIEIWVKLTPELGRNEMRHLLIQSSDGLSGTMPAQGPKKASTNQALQQ